MSFDLDVLFPATPVNAKRKAGGQYGHVAYNKGKKWSELFPEEVQERWRNSIREANKRCRSTEAWHKAGAKKQSKPCVRVSGDGRATIYESIGAAARANKGENTQKHAVTTIGSICNKTPKRTYNQRGKYYEIYRTEYQGYRWYFIDDPEAQKYINNKNKNDEGKVQETDGNGGYSDKITRRRCWL